MVFFCAFVLLSLIASLSRGSSVVYSTFVLLCEFVLESGVAMVCIEGGGWLLDLWRSVSV